MIFTLSPGRCGTKYLKHVLESVPGVESVHEGIPNFIEAWPEALRSRDVARWFWLEEKLPAIEATSAQTYFETSHHFKGYAAALLALSIVPDILVIERPHREVALSFWRRKSIPGKSERGRKYLLHPDGPVLLKIKRWKRLSDYQLCYWYCLETEAMVRALARQFSTVGATVHRTSLAELLTLKGFWAITEAFGLPTPRWHTYNRMKDWQVNVTPHAYRSSWPRGDLDAQEQQVRERIERT